MLGDLLLPIGKIFLLGRLGGNGSKPRMHGYTTKCTSPRSSQWKYNHNAGCDQKTLQNPNTFIPAHKSEYSWGNLAPLQADTSH